MKVTVEGIKAKIRAETYLVLPDGRTTLCVLALQNGYTIKGMSACVDAAEFDLDLGRKYAFEDAFRQIWALEGYLLAEKMYWDAARPVATNPRKQWTAKKVGRKIVAKHTKFKAAFTASRDMVITAPHGFKKDGTPKSKPGRKTAK